MPGHRPPVRPTGRWMLRHARQMREDPVTFLATTAAALGDVVEFPVPGRPVLFVNDPAAAQRVLRDNHRSYGKRTVQYDTLALVTGQGLLTADREPWLEHRRVQQPAFHHGALEPLVAAAVGAADRVSTRWDRAPEGSLVDVERAMGSAALEIVGESLFSSDFGGQPAQLVDAVLDALREVLVRAQNPLAPDLAVPTPSNRRMRRALRRIDAAVEVLLARRRREPPGSDVLSRLLASDLDDREVRDEVVTLLVAGHETAASALTWAWHLLGTDDHHGARLRAEVDAVTGAGAAARPPTWGDLDRLVVTRRVIDETLRLYPPAWVVTRRALAEDVLAGVTVPEGAMVVIGTHALHHRADVWPRPDLFDPGRFTRLTPTQRQAYLPFGAGPRLCIGRDLALLEMTVLLARLSQRYVLRPVAADPVRIAAGVTLRLRGGLVMRLERRS